MTLQPLRAPAPAGHPETHSLDGGTMAAMLRALVASVQGVALVVSEAGRIRFTTREVEEWLGWRVEEVVGRRVHRFLESGRGRAAFALFGRTVAAEGALPPVEARVRHADGSWRILQLQGRLLDPESGIAGMLVVARDVTESRVLQEALGESERMLFQSQRGEVLGRLASGIAHDFNNVIAAVKGYVQLMQLDVEEDHPFREYLGEVDGAANRAASLSRQILAFYRGAEPSAGLVPLHEVVEGMRPMLSRLLTGGVALRTLPAAEPVHVWADAAQLEQVLLNLVVNARDAMPRGGEVVVAVERAEVRAAEARVLGLLPGPYAVLRVADTGTGMDEATRARIFEPLFTTKAPGEGTGLGLATVARIVRNAHGAIEVRSEPGRGSEFRVLLPWVETTVQPGAAAQLSAMPRGSETLLLLEPDPMLRRITRTVLQRYGYTVEVAGSAAEAAALALRHASTLGLFVYDAELGAELVARVRAAIPRTRTLALSSVGALPADGGALPKPYSPAELLHAVRAALDAPPRRSLSSHG